MRPTSISLRSFALVLPLVLTAAFACGDDDKSPGGGSGGRGGAGRGGGSSAGDAGEDTTGAGKGGTSQGGDGGTGNEGNEPGIGGAGGVGGAAPLVCEDFWPEPPAATDCDLEALPDSGMVLTGDISADLTLASDQTYLLSGPTRVLPGVTLTIEPCVKIMGDAPEAVLAILAGDDGDGNATTNGPPGPGGQIYAVGEPTRPIVFTSSKAAGARLPGDWGGIIVLGNAQVNDNTATARRAIEGLEKAEPYGWHTPEFNDESSGTIDYVRIEYVGRDLGNNNETNGITFGGVGSGTTVDHVMVSNSIDDCFEWFGGTVGASHLVALNCDDDMFDTDFGYSGSVQFAFGRQYATSLESDSNGFEMDNHPMDFARTPQTAATWSNVTLCGTVQDTTLLTSPRVGMVLRRGVGGSIMNTLVTGFDSGGIAVQDATSNIAMTFSTVFDNSAVLNPTLHNQGADWFSAQEGNSEDPPADFCGCWSDPPIPVPLEGVVGGVPTGFGDPAAEYVGAFPNAQPDSNWMTGTWTDWSAE